jgi:hypothetical protein
MTFKEDLQNPVALSLSKGLLHEIKNVDKRSSNGVGYAERF